MFTIRSTSKYKYKCLDFFLQVRELVYLVILGQILSQKQEKGK